MMKPVRSSTPTALDLLEESVHLLRVTPAMDYLVWAAGMGPFMLGLLYFWADMSRAAYAITRLLPAALGLAVLFLWLKICQSVFAARQLARLTGTEAPWTMRRWLGVLVVQAAWQPFGLFLLPFALVLTVPFGWLFALAQNLPVLADSAQGCPFPAFRRAARQCLLWPGQNHALITLLFLAFMVVWLNIGVALFLLPHLLKLFLGIESHFTLSHESTLNTTFLATTFALALAALDPLVKAAYVLRCFHGESRRTGEDLRAQIRRWPKLAAVVAVALALLGLFPGTFTNVVAAPTLPETVQANRVNELDHAINNVLERPDYTWRAPRESSREVPAVERGNWLARAMSWIGDQIEQRFRSLGRLVKRLADWLDQVLNRNPRSSSPSNLSFNPAGFVNFLMWLLLVCATGVLLWFAFTVWRRRTVSPVLTATPVVLLPDLQAEHVAVEQLPEDGWLTLARELAAKGELRLAIRALYLASLAHLAHREFILPARFKSNRDYELEVCRRARAVPALPEAFAETVRAFDRVWYGGHEVSADLFASFDVKVQEVRSC